MHFLWSRDVGRIRASPATTGMFFVIGPRRALVCTRLSVPSGQTSHRFQRTGIIGFRLHAVRPGKKVKVLGVIAASNRGQVITIVMGCNASYNSAKPQPG